MKYYLFILLTCCVMYATTAPVDPMPFEEEEEPEEEKAIKEVCFDGLGCFAKEKPWVADGRICRLPQTPEKINTKFLLFTRRNTEAPIRIFTGDKEKLGFSTYDPSKPVKFIIHGYNDGIHTGWMREMAMQFLIQGDVNVIIVDWTVGSKALMYGVAAANIRVVAVQLTQLLQFLSSQAGLKYEDVHLVGHSLGAHMAGLVGAQLKKIGRITGMEPAGPYFAYQDPAIRLDETDALFVDAIHSDAGGLKSHLIHFKLGGFGTWQPSGHVDIYVNNGLEQPGCNDSAIKTIINQGLPDSSGYIFACHHNRAYQIASEVIGSRCPYQAFACPDYQEFLTGQCLHYPKSNAKGDLNKIRNFIGVKAIKPSDGSGNNTFWLATSPTAPYCVYHYHVQLTLSQKTNKEQKGKIYFKLTGNRGDNDYYAVNDNKHFSIKSGAVFDFLVTSPVDVGETVKSVEVKWEHDASWYDVGQWSFKKQSIFIEKVTVFSGEHQTEFSFCDPASEEPFISKDSRVLTTKC